MESIKNFILMGRGGLMTSSVLNQMVSSGLSPTAVIIEKTSYDHSFPNLTENLCIAEDIPYLKSDINDGETVKFIRQHEPKLVVVASLGKILTKELLENSTFINVHMGMLPAERGAHTIFWNILNDSDTFGISIHEMTEAIDRGKLYTQAKIDLPEIEDGFELHKQLYIEAGKQTCDFLNNYPDSLNEMNIPDNNSENYFSKFDPKYLHLDIDQSFDTLAKKMNRLQYYGFPRIEVKGTEYKISHAVILQSIQADTQTGDIKVYSDQEVLFLEHNGNVLRLTTCNHS